jgi:hypothetical protein
LSGRHFAGYDDEQQPLLRKAHPDTRERFDRVVRLVDGLETPFALELLATVHWVMQEQRSADPRIVEESTHAWGRRKQSFTSGQIRLAAERLSAQGWAGAASVR